MTYAMRRRACSGNISLTSKDASIVKGMLNRGDRQSDIASWFGVNSGRIAEISTGATFYDIPVAEEQSLPPPGPYVVRELVEQQQKIVNRV
ncbi:MAG: hypothetical protein OXF74_04265 [Rhodobacteraceae bacterium]|nr:hypothetical protein [Paracoccaceae bacterium]